MQLQDGTGKGYWVKIDSYNRLHTYSTLKPEISDISINRDNAFSITTPVYTFNSTNEHPLLFIKNINPDLILFFSSIIYSYNGGDTNHDRVMIKRVYSCPGTPTDRYEEIEPINIKIRSSNSAMTTTYGWDGIGDGMEIDLSDANNFSTSMVQKGSLVLNEIEAVALQYNACILISYEPEEIGKASVSTKFYFNHV